MKKNFKLPVVAALTVALTAPAMANTTYPDVLSDSWYTAAIESAVSNELLGGYEDGTMRPGSSITRAEIASVISKAFGASEKAELDGFYDVSSKQWFYDAMAKAVHMELFTGDNNKCLNPSNPITREETAIVVAKAFELSHSGEDVLADFVDGNEVSAWAKDYVSALVENGYMAGNDKGELNPKGNITRAEFAQIMYNITNDYIVEEGTVKTSYDGNVVVRATDVVMKDLTVDGDVVVADGVGRGDFTLDNATINGNLVIRGGGVNSIHFKNGAKVKGSVITRNHSGKTRITADDKSSIEELVVNTDVIIDAKCDTVTVNTSSDVEVLGEVKTIDVNAENVDVTGKGKVETVNANADDVKVTVVGTNVVAADDVEGVKAGDKTVEAGESEVVKKTSSGGGSGGSSSSSKPKTVNLVYTITETDDAYEITALSSNGNVSDFDDRKYAVTIKGDIFAEDIEKTIESGADAIRFAGELLLNDAIEMERVINTIDDMEISKLYDVEDYAAEVDEAIGILLGTNSPEYIKLKEARDAALEGKTAAEVKLADVYAEYDGDAKALVQKLLNKVKDNDIYSAVFEYFIEKEWTLINSLITK